MKSIAAIVGFGALMVFVGLFRPLSAEGRWVLIAILMVLLLNVLGRIETSFGWGILVDARKKMSLPRLQLVAWTVVVFSAVLASALWNISEAKGLAAPLDIAIPKYVWSLMGISMASFIGSPIIKSNKRDKGELQEHATIDKAETADLVSMEETENQDLLDLGKVQMLLITLVVLVAYSAALLALFRSAGKSGITEFPNMSEGMLALVGLSHTGYLTYKAVPKT